VQANTPLQANDLAMRRPASGIAPAHALELVGKRLRADAPAGHVLQWADLA
jgi:sialic acid synthase SpsE